MITNERAITIQIVDSWTASFGPHTSMDGRGGPSMRGRIAHKNNDLTIQIRNMKVVGCRLFNAQSSLSVIIYHLKATKICLNHIEAVYLELATNSPQWNDQWSTFKISTRCPDDP